MRVHRPECDTLNKLLRVSNAAAAAFQQPLLYANGQNMAADNHAQKRGKKLSDNGHATITAAGLHSSTGDGLSSCFHISIAWTLHEPGAPMQQSLEALVEDEDFHINLNVNAIKTKIGNAVTNISLTIKQSSSNDFYLA